MIRRVWRSAPCMVHPGRGGPWLTPTQGCKTPFSLPTTQLATTQPRKQPSARQAGKGWLRSTPRAHYSNPWVLDGLQFLLELPQVVLCYHLVLEAAIELSDEEVAPASSGPEEANPDHPSHNCRGSRGPCRGGDGASGDHLQGIYRASGDGL